jgi:hypothetical protein
VTKGAEMFRTALLAGAAVLEIPCTIASLTQRATAPDRLVSVEITIKPNGDFASVLYRAANGAAYSRGQQYEATSGQDGAEHY